MIEHFHLPWLVIHNEKRDDIIQIVSRVHFLDGTVCDRSYRKDLLSLPENYWKLSFLENRRKERQYNHGVQHHHTTVHHADHQRHRDEAAVQEGHAEGEVTNFVWPCVFLCTKGIDKYDDRAENSIENWLL